METKMLGPEACPEWGAGGDPAFVAAGGGGGVAWRSSVLKLQFRRTIWQGHEGTGGNGNGTVDGDL